MEINDNLLRYLTLRMDAKMLRHYEQQQRKRQQGGSGEAEAS